MKQFQAKKSDNKRALILAAGKGTRMKSDLPKVVIPLEGKPMIQHVIDALTGSGIDKIYIIVGYAKNIVMKAITNQENISIEFIEQTEQLGTAHAVLCAEHALGNYNGLLLITNGDMPLISPDTYFKLTETHIQNDNGVTVLSARMENPTGYGRLIRTEAGALMKIVEERDADQNIKTIKEVNTGAYVFNCPEIFGIIKKIDSNNKMQEFYLPDVVAVNYSSGHVAGSFEVQTMDESLGANSPDDFSLLEKRHKIRT